MPGMSPPLKVTHAEGMALEFDAGTGTTICSTWKKIEINELYAVCPKLRSVFFDTVKGGISF